MNETFSAGRFFRYFLFDNKQLWSRHTRAVVTFGGLGIILYIVSVILGLIFTQQWHGPVLWARVITLAFASLVLVFYQTRTYGYLTDPKAGAAWLMVPASRLEKFLSMMIITLIEMPLTLLATYLCIDGIITLVDPTVEGAIISSVGTIYSQFNNFVSQNATRLTFMIDIKDHMEYTEEPVYDDWGTLIEMKRKAVIPEGGPEKVKGCFTVYIIDKPAEVSSF